MGRVAALQDMLIKEGLAQHLIEVAMQGFQQAILAAGQPGPLPGKQHIAQLVVENQALRVAAQQRRHRPPIQGHPSQDRLDAHPQLGHAEGLGQVVVGSEAKTADAISLRPQGRHQQHRRGMTLAQVGQQGEPIHAGQQDVHQHHIEVLAAGHPQALLAVAAPGHGKAAATQLLMHIGAEHRVIFNGQDTGGLNSYGSH